MTVQAKAGKTFAVTLTSNPSTGYSWGLAAEPDKKLVTFVKSNYTHGKSNADGAGGTETWTFKAVAKGKTTITLEYLRSWEKKSAIQTQTYDVVIS